MIVCEECGQAGGTLVRTGAKHSGRYRHDPRATPCDPTARLHHAGLTTAAEGATLMRRRLWLPETRRSR